MNTQSMNKKHYDIVIVGGGMVGSALACALGNSSLKIAVIEGRKPDFDWSEDSYDIRVSAITRASQRLFEKLNVWETMCEQRISPYSEMFVWDATGDGSIHFDCAEIGEPNLGHIIENRVITRALVKQAEQFDNIDLFCPSTPLRLLLHTDHTQLELENGTLLESDLLVGADGGKSWVRQQAGIQVDTKWSGAKTFFGSEGLIMLRISGTGTLIISSYGAIHEMELSAGEEYVIDTGHLVTFEEHLEFNVKKVAGWKSTLFSGEGLVIELKGPGKLTLQSRSQDSFLSWLIPQLPQKTDYST